MTGKNVTGDGSWVKDSTGALYEDGIDPTVVKPRIVKDIATSAIKTGSKILGEIANRGAVARVEKKYVFSRPGNMDSIYPLNDNETIGRPSIYSDDGRFSEKYTPKRAGQTWLQKMTDNMGRYVYGAAVRAGEYLGIHIADDLMDDKEECENKYHSGSWKDAAKLAKRYWQYLVTWGHERAHMNGVDDENDAERDGYIFANNETKTNKVANFVYRVLNKRNYLNDTGSGGKTIELDPAIRGPSIGSHRNYRNVG